MKTTMAMMRDYMRYGMGLELSKIQKLSEADYSNIKNYYFKSEGYELDATYEEFMEFVAQYK